MMGWPQRINRRHDTPGHYNNEPIVASLKMKQSFIASVADAHVDSFGLNGRFAQREAFGFSALSYKARNRDGGRSTHLTLPERLTIFFRHRMKCVLTPTLNPVDESPTNCERDKTTFLGNSGDCLPTGEKTALSIPRADVE